MTIDERIEAAANEENPVNALRSLADDIAHESGTGAEYERVIDRLDAIRIGAENRAASHAPLCGMAREEVGSCTCNERRSLRRPS